MIVCAIVVSVVYKRRVDKKYLKLLNDLNTIYLNFENINSDKICVQYIGFLEDMKYIDYN